MSCAIRSLLSRAQRPDRGPVAPGSLRKRVLAGVRGEPPPHRSSLVLPAAGVVVLLLAAIGVMTLISTVERSGGPRERTGAGAHALLRRSKDRGELEVSNLAEPPVGEVYEVWLERSGSPPHPTDALFTVTHSGEATVEVPGSLRGVRVVMITAEPLGGSSSPTSAPILSVTVPSA